MLKAKEKKENYKKLAIVLVVLFLIIGLLGSGIMPSKRTKISKKVKSKQS